MCKKTQQIVTIDGPAGVGKSTVSRGVADRIGFTYLDTGAMYRAVAYHCVLNHIDADIREDVASSLDDINILLKPPRKDNDDVCVYLNDREIGKYIRTPEIGALASKVSAYKDVRQMLTQMQQKLGASGRIVAEGRDTGTVVFPGAAWKFYLDASPETRAKRRADQLREKGEQVNEQELLALIIKRDKADSQRALAPLKPASDAQIIDSSLLSAVEVIERMLSYIRI